MRIRFLEKYGLGDPTVLITGTHEDFRRLSDTFRALGSGDSGEVDISALADEPGDVSLRARGAENGRGLRQLDKVEGRHSFEWRVPRLTWEEFAQKTLAVADSKHPSHNYLDGEDDDAMVVIAYGEREPGENE